MKKIFTLIAVAAMAMGVNAQEKVILSFDGLSSANKVEFEGGYTLQITGNETKELSGGNNITVNDATKKSIKLSNGAQNTLTLPSGKSASKITFHSYINYDGGTGNKDMAKFRTSYWSEVGGTTYTAESATLMTQFLYTYNNENGKKVTTYGAWVNGENNKDGKFDAISFSLASAPNVITFTNTGEQACFVIELELTGSNNINTVKTVEAEDSAAYNLAGQKVADGFKGIVVKNGRKMIQK